MATPGHFLESTTGIMPLSTTIWAPASIILVIVITPFWALVGATIAGIDFRQYFGYRLIFAGLWFVMGVLAFTFLLC